MGSVFLVPNGILYAVLSPKVFLVIFFQVFRFFRYLLQLLHEPRYSPLHTGLTSALWKKMFSCEKTAMWLITLQFFHKKTFFSKGHLLAQCAMVSTQWFMQKLQKVPKKSKNLKKLLKTLLVIKPHIEINLVLKTLTPCEFRCRQVERCRFFTLIFFELA